MNFKFEKLAIVGISAFMLFFTIFNINRNNVDYVHAACGDSVLDGADICDDGNLIDGDGCSSSCTVESGYSCVGEPSSCVEGASVISSVTVPECGNLVIEGNEVCDNGKHCANLVSCTTDADCVGNGDGLCIKRNTEACNNTCSGAYNSGVGGNGGGENTSVILSTVTAYPEFRYTGNGDNYDTDFYLKILNPQDHTVIYSIPGMLSSSNTGVAFLNITLPISAGLYDISIKSESHISRVLNDVYLAVGNNDLNFTNLNNSSSIGNIRLLAGDVNSSSIGDDVINAIDISTLLHDYGSSDYSGNAIRSNLNQDNTVDESDLNILLNNIDLSGQI